MALATSTAIAQIAASEVNFRTTTPAGSKE
jgi:hypothetical protein